MKVKFIIILFTGILIGAMVTYLAVPKAKAPETEISQEAQPLYSCGMHPEVISDKPGNCPICGMKLTPIQRTGPQAARAGEKKERKILYWRAPMDPTEIYDRPGKSKMGMDLVPVYEGEEAHGAGSITIDAAIQQNMNLRTAPVERRDIYRMIRAYGRVTYAQDREYTVTTKINGWIEKLYVNTEGQQVREGEPLLEIYSPELVSTQEEYLLALNNYKKLEESPYESVRKSAERMLNLSRERLEFWDISDDEIRKIEKTGKVRRTIQLRSQLTGVVTHKNVKEGDKVGPGGNLFHIADLSRVWVEAAVYESELPLIRKGQTAELELDQLQGHTLKGKVDFIYPYLDQKARANNVRLVFDNPQQILKPDMFATVRIFAHVADESLAIPAEAVIHSGKRAIVFVTRGEGKFEPREVKIGAEAEDGYVQVVTGLFEGEHVVVSGQFLLDSESRMREAIAKMRAASAKGAQAPPMKEEESKPHTAAEEPLMEEPASKQEAEAHEKHEMPQVLHEPTALPAEKKEKKEVSIDINRLYTCPMHPEFLTTDPDARCPICEMKVVAAKGLGDKVDLEKAEFYTCPMHPEFLTTDPDARCPECGMKLEKVKKRPVRHSGKPR